MGKSSRRPRDKPGRTTPAKSPDLPKMLFGTCEEFVQNEDVLQHADLPPQREFASVEAALRWFESELRWNMARYVPTYPSHRLCELLADRLQVNPRCIMDQTSLVPFGRNGRQSDLPVLLTTLIEDEDDTKLMHVLLRTEENTPAFLCGLYHWFVHREGGESEAKETSQSSRHLPQEWS